ncbi:hypothetical protein CR513_04026, partial [Mucuna pruriens]
MNSDLIRSHVAVHALVTACSRGFVDIIEILLKRQYGLDLSAADRLLLQSLEPSLDANVDCNNVCAAVIHRQVPVVGLLLKNGARIDHEARLGAWSWDISTAEELRVGAELGEPYPITWCAVEYFEKSGAILRMLLHHVSPNRWCLCAEAHKMWMLGSEGLLHWGKSSHRNVKCCEEELGSSLTFRRNRCKKGDADEPGMFRVLTNKNKEVHFVCDGGLEVAELWVRGIKLVTREAMFVVSPSYSYHKLVYVGADVKLCSKSGETTISLFEVNQSRGLLEKLCFNLDFKGQLKCKWLLCLSRHNEWHNIS